MTAHLRTWLKNMGHHEPLPDTAGHFSAPPAPGKGLSSLSLLLYLLMNVFFLGPNGSIGRW
jgi:hypothetical protein